MRFEPLSPSPRMQAAALQSLDSRPWTKPDRSLRGPRNNGHQRFTSAQPCSRRRISNLPVANGIQTHDGASWRDHQTILLAACSPTLGEEEGLHNRRARRRYDQRPCPIRSVMTVLIFDSDMLVRNDLKLMFELNGVVANCTGDLRKALSLMTSGAYSFVVAGVSQYAEGIPTFAKAMRSAPRRLPLIVGAAHQAETLHLRTVSAYVQFPVSPNDLSRLVKGAVRVSC